VKPSVNCSPGRSDADRHPRSVATRSVVRVVFERNNLDLARHSVDWMTLDDNHAALRVDGGGIDGGKGAYFANAGEDLHVVGSVAPLIPGHVGCIVIRPDKTRGLARAVPDPLAGQKPD